MHVWLLLLTISSAFTQDERNFRSLFSGQEQKAVETIDRLGAKFQQASPLYQIDFTTGRS